MSYENAPATKMLATHCAACGRPLVDAVSIETGLGPICRDKYGYNTEVAETIRKLANTIVYTIALDPQGLKALQNAEALREIGFPLLADVITKRIATVRVLMVDGRLRLVTPYNENFLNAIRQIPGRQWHKEEKVWSFPLTARAAVQDALAGTFAGKLAIGPKGPFVIAKAA
jgi:Family of unknown function (DUF6011)